MPTTKTTAKTPYEIRLSLLQMAKDHLDFMFNANAAFISQITAAAINANASTLEELKALAPKPYTIEDITNKASELYAFVLKKSV